LPKKDEHALGGACYVRLSSLLDIGRLSCALERAPFPLFAFKAGTSLRIAAPLDLYMGTQILYYTDTSESGEFLAYRTTTEGEEVQLVPSASNASFLYAPVIRIKKMPAALSPKDSFESRFMSAEVEDIPNLVKVGTYKVLFEEPPLPLFAFKKEKDWIVGTFARIDDYEEASIFFYARSQEEPSAGFMKYSPDKISETAYTKRTNEHGFQYIKVVKLAEPHPLIQF